MEGNEYKRRKSGNIGYIVELQELKWQQIGNNRQHFGDGNNGLPSRMGGRAKGARRGNQSPDKS